MEKNERLINIGKKTFISVVILLLALMAVSIALTYILPKGEYGTVIIDGVETIDYENYIPLEGLSGISIIKGLLAPFLILASSDGLSIIILCIFLLVISGAFQAMNDCQGIKVIVKRVISRFKNHKFVLVSIITLLFMLFGSVLGLFEEMLTLLPIAIILMLSLGYDSFSGFLVSIIACGFGFSSSLTNPFTILFASNIIGVNPLINFWYRVIIFLVMYGLFELFIYAYLRRISRHPEKSLTYQKDEIKRENLFKDEIIPNEKKIFWSYVIFFIFSLGIIVTFSLVDSLRDYTIPALIIVFLFGGIIASLISTNNDYKATFKSFLMGILSALPTVVFVLLASSIKYILIEGKVLPSITHTINDLVSNSNIYVTALILFVIILVLEFFISSSTAKAIFVMSILGVLSLGLTKEMQVLIYTFADGYTNLLFPTSPVLLIGLSMVGVPYFKWLKRSWPLFTITFILVIGFILLGIVVCY